MTQELRGTARNIFFREGEARPLIPMVEGILLVSEPHHSVDEAGDVVTRRQMSELRFTATAEGMRALSEVMVAWADEADERAAALTKETDDAEADN